MNTLSTIFLHSARMYSSMADAIFNDSVEWSQFASTVSGMRMQTAKAIIGTSRDIEIELDDEDMEILDGAPGWQACLALDNLLMREMADHNEAQFLPILTGVFVAAHKGVAYASNANDRPENKLCLACGAISEQWTCPVCGNERNWLTSVEIPENEEEATEPTEKGVSLPNISFGDYAPELPVQPPKWEVSFDGRKGDIFTATGLARPQLG